MESHVRVMDEAATANGHTYQRARAEEIRLSQRLETSELQTAAVSMESEDAGMQ